jgi:predicted ribosome quality control (RQC) complex YloA/Tae2 family protein
MEWKVLEKFKLIPDESLFFDFTPEELTLLFYVLGLSASKSLTIDELNTLANGLFETAQVMFVIASQRTLLNEALEAQQEKETVEKAKEEKNSAEKLALEIQKLQDKIECLQKQIDELKK